MPNSHHTKKIFTINFHTCIQGPRKQPRGCPEIFCIDMYMSYRWRESFNTVNRQIRDVITTGIDMCGRRMRKGGGGGGWAIHPSRRWLISCARTTVLYVCLSIALTSCTTSMAETNLDAIRKQKNAEYSKRCPLKRKMKMQQQAPTTSEAEPEKLQV